MGMYAAWYPVGRGELSELGAMGEDELTEWMETEPPSFDVDKMWHGVHAVLTGTDWDTEGPLGQAVLGGREVGEDLGYGPMRMLDAEEVRAVASALQALSVEEFRTRIDFGALARMDIYPSVIWTREDEQPDLLDELSNGFEVIRHGYGAAAEAGQAMVLFIT